MKKAMTFFCAILIVFTAGVLSCGAQEQLTITTYYPSPLGIYNDLRADRLAVGNDRAFAGSGEVSWGRVASRGLLTPDQGASIELGGTNAAYTPYIDFSRSSNDYDGRIILLDANRLGIYVADRLEIRTGTGANDYADIVVRDLVLCQ